MKIIKGFMKFLSFCQQYLNIVYKFLQTYKIRLKKCYFKRKC